MAPTIMFIGIWTPATQHRTQTHLQICKRKKITPFNNDNAEILEVLSPIFKKCIICYFFKWNYRICLIYPIVSILNQNKPFSMPLWMWKIGYIKCVLNSFIKDIQGNIMMTQSTKWWLLKKCRFIWPWMDRKGSKRTTSIKVDLGK